MKYKYMLVPPPQTKTNYKNKKENMRERKREREREREIIITLRTLDHQRTSIACDNFTPCRSHVLDKLSLWPFGKLSGAIWS